MKNFPKKLDSKTSCLRIAVPENLDLALEGLIRKVLREQPKTDDMYTFAANYFETLLRIRDKAGRKYAAEDQCAFHHDEDAHEMIKLANTFPKPVGKMIASSSASNKTEESSRPEAPTPPRKKENREEVAAGSAGGRGRPAKESGKLTHRPTPDLIKKLPVTSQEETPPTEAKAGTETQPPEHEGDPLEEEEEFLKSDPIKELVEKELQEEAKGKTELGTNEAVEEAASDEVCGVVDKFSVIPEGTPGTSVKEVGEKEEENKPEDGSGDKPHSDENEEKKESEERRAEVSLDEAKASDVVADLKEESDSKETETQEAKEVHAAESEAETKGTSEESTRGSEKAEVVAEDSTQTQKDVVEGSQIDDKKRSEILPNEEIISNVQNPQEVTMPETPEEIQQKPSPEEKENLPDQNRQRLEDVKKEDETSVEAKPVGENKSGVHQVSATEKEPEEEEIKTDEVKNNEEAAAEEAEHKKPTAKEEQIPPPAAAEEAENSNEDNKLPTGTESEGVEKIEWNKPEEKESQPGDEAIPEERDHPAGEEVKQEEKEKLGGEAEVEEGKPEVEVKEGPSVEVARQVLLSRGDSSERPSEERPREVGIEDGKSEVVEGKPVQEKPPPEALKGTESKEEDKAEVGTEDAKKEETPEKLPEWKVHTEEGNKDSATTAQASLLSHNEKQEAEEEKEIKEETKGVKEETKGVKEETKETKEEMKETKEEMKETKEGTKEAEKEKKEEEEEKKEVKEETKETKEEMKETKEGTKEAEKGKKEEEEEKKEVKEETKEVKEEMKETKEGTKEAEKEKKEAEEEKKEVKEETKETKEGTKEAEEEKEEAEKEKKEVKEEEKEGVEGKAEVPTEELCTVVDSQEILRVTRPEKSEEDLKERPQEEKQIKTIETHYYDLLQVPETVTKEYKVHHTPVEAAAIPGEVSLPVKSYHMVKESERVADELLSVGGSHRPQSEIPQEEFRDLTTLTSGHSVNLSETNVQTLSEMFLNSEKQYSSLEKEEIRYATPKSGQKQEEEGRKEVEEVMRQTILPSPLGAVPVQPREAEEIEAETNPSATEETKGEKKQEDKPENKPGDSSSDDSNTDRSRSNNSRSFDSDTPIISVEVKTVIETQDFDEKEEEESPRKEPNGAPDVEVRVQATIDFQEEEAAPQTAEADDRRREEKKPEEIQSGSNDERAKEAASREQTLGREGSSGESDTTISSAATQIKRSDSLKRNFSASRSALATQSLDSGKRSTLVKTRSLSAIRHGVTDFEVWNAIEKELEEAATKIQSKFRGYATRKRLRREDAVQITTEESSSTTPTEQDVKEERQQSTGEFHDSIVLSEHPR